MLQHANFILLDAAILGPVMDEARARNKAQASLFAGSPADGLDGVAPFLFRYAHASDFADWVRVQGWGQAWGIYLNSPWPMPELQKHLQHLLRVKSEDGQQFLFRFYDPRVLRVFLPTCDAAQLREFFGEGHIGHCIVEDTDPGFALRFRLEHGVLKTERFEVTALSQRQACSGEQLRTPEEYCQPAAAGGWNAVKARWNLFEQ